MKNWLFPAEPRDFPFRREIRGLLRASHVLTSALLLGAVFFGQSPEVISQWALWTLGTGVVLLITDLIASCVIIFEWRGLSILVKLFLAMLIQPYPQQAFVLLSLALFIGVISSHLSRRFRHRLWWRPFPMQVDKRAG